MYINKKQQLVYI